ncbi:helix-turn-helix domain-containing protein [Burkholderia sp. Bp9002]|nr:helix-turn-helix domain-containing protein [Burkholderia sp. Bp9002]
MGRAWWNDFRSGDIDELSGHLHAFQWRYDQLEPGRFLGRIAEIDLPGVSVFREQLSRSTRQVGTTPPGTMGLTLTWNRSGNMWANGVRMTEGYVGVSAHMEVEFFTASDSDFAYVVVDSGVVDDTLARTDTVMAPDIRGNTAISLRLRDAEPTLRQLFALAHGTLGEAPESLQSVTARRLLADQFVMEFIDVVSMPSSIEERHAARRVRMVDRARELMHGRTEEPLSILEVCRHVGVSRRKLNYCFQDVLGTTPLAYMRAIRLNSVRREMLACARNEGVSDIAVRWGFWHLGRFSTDYKRHFGELPSHTLQRGRASRAR